MIDATSEWAHSLLPPTNLQQMQSWQHAAATAGCAELLLLGSTGLSRSPVLRDLLQRFDVQVNSRQLPPEGAATVSIMNDTTTTTTAAAANFAAAAACCLA